MNAISGFPLFDCMPDVGDTRAAIAASLLLPNASISPRYFYDSLGCALYEAITRLDEYYPTRTERTIFEKQVGSLQRVWPAGAQYVDLGSGDGEKAAALLPILKPESYLAVDIARTAIESALPRLAKVAPQVRLSGVVTDFAETFNFAFALDDAPRVFVYPGSSIGNFTPPEAINFLKRIREHCVRSEDRLLIGVDSVKSTERLNAAYDDALGVTAAFNLNILRHVNRLIGSDFDVRDWKHSGGFNPQASRIEMELEARSEVKVSINGSTRSFATGERIHTENSYKYSRDAFDALLVQSGFTCDQYFTDESVDFHVFFARPA